MRSLRARCEALGKAKVEQVERLVCGLYGLDDELTDAVVEHAVTRARRARPAGE